MCDLEAGIVDVMTIDATQLDLLILVANPTENSLEVARRVLALAQVASLPVLGVANRVRDADEANEVLKEMEGYDVVVVPEDPDILGADRAGSSVVDAAPNAASVQALRELARRVEGLKNGKLGKRGFAPS